MQSLNAGSTRISLRGNEQAQETCRDLEHTGHSLASISHVIETARIQNDDMYKTEIWT
jgi:hypothetical protein